MAVSKLGIYNGASQLIGERRLNTLMDDTEHRYELDSIWELGAVNYCLEQVKPTFATRTLKLESTTPSDEHDLDNVHTLPSDFVAIVELYSDSKLDQPLMRYINDGSTISCEYTTVYLRYISSSVVDNYTNWSASFVNVLTVYIATELAERLNSDSKELLLQQYDSRLKKALELENQKEPSLRSKPTSVTLTQTWLNIYNDALLILGLERLTDVNGDSNSRSVIDTAINSGLVETLLENKGWQWAIKSEKLTHDPSLESEWGYRYSFRLPSDVHRFDGIWYDEYFSSPIKGYEQENNIIFTDVTECYIQYVSKSYLKNPDGWRPSFKRYVAAKIAYDTYTVLGGDKERVLATYDQREREALSIDAQQSPPHILTTGNWVRQRRSSLVNRDRGRR